MADIVDGQMEESTQGSFPQTTDEEYERVFRAFTMSPMWLLERRCQHCMRGGWGDSFISARRTEKNHSFHTRAWSITHGAAIDSRVPTGAG